MKDNAPIRHYVRQLPAVAAPSTPVQQVDIDGGQGDSSEIGLREYLRLIVKHRYLIAGSTLIVGLVALIYVFTVTPRYTAQSKVRISTYEPILSATKIEDMLQQKSKETNYFDTQIKEITSFSLADRVLQDPEVMTAIRNRGEPGFLSRILGLGRGSKVDGQAPVDDLISGYKNSLKEIRNYLELIVVSPVRRTSLVDISVTLRDPRAAALVANKHALAYVDWVRANRIEQQARGLTFLRSQADELREKVSDLERESADYAEANSIVALNKDENITVQKMSQLNVLLTSATGKRIEAEHAYEEALRASKSDSAGIDDVSVQTMRSELGRLEAERNQLGTKFTSNYPKMQQLDSQISRLKGAITAQREQLLTGLKAKALAIAEEEKNLREELEQQKSQTFELSKRQVQYNVLNRELTTSRDLLQNVLRQIKETSLAVESNSSNVSVVDYAMIPETPSYPRKRLYVLGGLLAGLLFGIAVALALSYLDNTVRTPDDVISRLKVPALGVVPGFESEKDQPERLKIGVAASAGAPAARGVIDGPPGGPTTVAPFSPLNSLGDSHPSVDSHSQFPVMFLKSPRSLASEAYRSIRTAILLSQAGEPPRTLLVTSAQSSEGKTTSSVNLAVSLASAGGRVCIIDADLRRPNVHKYFNIPSDSPGLVEVLTGHRSLADVAHRDLLKRLTVVTSGTIPPNPAELVGSVEMAGLIDRLASEFDYTIIDSPPILPVTDSVILSRYVDGVVLVVKSASTPTKVVMDAKNRLRNCGARILGIVLNNVDIRGGDYYYYNRYYYSYYRDEERSSAVG